MTSFEVLIRRLKAIDILNLYRLEGSIPDDLADINLGAMFNEHAAWLVDSIKNPNFIILKEEEELILELYSRSMEAQSSYEEQGQERSLRGSTGSRGC